MIVLLRGAAGKYELKASAGLADASRSGTPSRRRSNFTVGARARSGKKTMGTQKHSTTRSRVETLTPSQGRGVIPAIIAQAEVVGWKGVGIAGA